MKILHTSDWHIGKRLMGRERLDEQSDVLDEIAGICDREGVELVLVAGDIFDTYMPSAEAEELFFSKIKAVAGKDRAVLLISGNHDDGVRLSASAPVSEELGIYIVGNSRKPLPLHSMRKVRPVASGAGYAVFANERGERAFINTLPYPNEARFKEEKSDLPFPERMKKWIEEGEAGNTEGLPSVFLSHIFVAGGATSESEREIDLGGARAVPLDVLPKSDYIALGHLHKRQHMGKGHCYYSGSPLQYSFDEAGGEKGVKIFDLTRNGVEKLEDVPLRSGRRLVRLEADSPAAAEELLKLYPDALAEVRLYLSSPLTGTESAALAAHGNLVSLIAEVRGAEGMEFESRKGFSDSRLFEEFYRSQFGEEPAEELKALFLSVVGELEK